MLTASLRGMLTHRLRLVLTTVSIALGVAFLAGTLMLTDTMKLAFNQLFGKVTSGTDAVVRQEAAYSQTSGVAPARRPIEASVLDRVRKVEGVAAAEGSVSGYALLTDTAGRAVLAEGGAPTMGYSMPSDEALRGDVHVRTGRAPTGPSEVAIDATSADKGDIALGSTIKIMFSGPAREFTVVGTVGYGDETDLGGTTAAHFDTATAQQVLGAPGVFNEIQVRSADGVDDVVLAERLSAVVPDGVEAVTGATVAKEASDSITKNFMFLNIMFGVFAGISLFVGSFIIWNTFTMIVTQRAREIALLRSIGATRRQVRRSLLLEATVLGVAASVLGIGLGAGVATGLTALMGALGLSLPSTSLQVQPRTVWLSLVVGVAVTVAAAFVPARRAMKVLPIEALRDATPGARTPSKRRAAIGAVTAALGLAAILNGLYGDGGTTLVPIGILTVMIGVITLAPLAARPLASAIGAPLRWRGFPGELARQNAMRNPRRTASTAAALMIGLALVVTMGVFGSSLKASFGTILGESTNAELFLTPASAQGAGFSSEVSKIVADVPGVSVVSPTSWGTARIGGAATTYSSVDPATIESALNLEMIAGSASRLGSDGVLVSDEKATEKGWTVGDTVQMEFPTSGTQSLRISGVFAGSGFLNGSYVISRATHEANDPARLDANALVLVDKGASVGDVQDRIAAALAGHPDAQVLDRAGYEKQVGGMVNQVMAFVTVMLLLAVVIALLGIVNTLALSVFERTRELGLLRAVGMTRGQVRTMVRWESVVISLIGALVGAGLGTGFGVALSQSLKGDGITEVAVPGGQITFYVIAAALAGVLAAVGPARSAARVDVLRAVVTD